MIFGDLSKKCILGEGIYHWQMVINRFALIMLPLYLGMACNEIVQINKIISGLNYSVFFHESSIKAEKIFTLKIWSAVWYRYPIHLLALLHKHYISIIPCAKSSRETLQLHGNLQRTIALLYDLTLQQSWFVMPSNLQMADIKSYVEVSLLLFPRLMAHRPALASSTV